MTAITKKRVAVDGVQMAYIEEGHGDPIVLLHGNPTSSYLWRNIIPHLSGLGRVIAPDLVGMGDSDKLAPSESGTYRFVVHQRYLDGLLARLGVADRVVVVGQDWGSALAFDWARRHPDATLGVAHLEGIVLPWSTENWPMDPDLLSVFLGMRSSQGEAMVLEENAFVEGTMPSGTMRALTAEEMAEYRRPFVEPGESRRATLDWPREIPFDGAPADVQEIVEAYGAWLAQSPVPKLFIDAQPGFIIDDRVRGFIDTWPNQQKVTVRGRHFVQEDCPDDVGKAIAEWYQGI